jgi:hypothetical protein
VLAVPRTAELPGTDAAASPDPTGGQVRLDGPVVDRGTGALQSGWWDGRPVLVRRLSVGSDAGLRAHALLLARRLFGIDHAALVPVLTVDTDWDGLYLVCEFPEVVGSLATLITRRRLGPGEVLGLGLGVADALATLHRAGLCHGRLSAADLLIGSAGSVLLTGYGVAGVLGSAGSPEEDVADLVRLLAVCLEDGDRPERERPADERLRRELDHLGADPRRTAADLLAALAELPIAAEPIRLPGRRPAPAVHRHRPRRRWRPVWTFDRLPTARVGWRVLGAALPAAVGVLLLAGWLGASLPDAARETPAAGADGRSVAPVSPASTAPRVVPAVPPRTAPAPARAPASAPAQTDWRAVLIGLDQARSQLFAGPDEARLSTVDAPGSSAYADDRVLVRDLVAQHAASSGLNTEVLSVRVGSTGPTHAELTVVDVLHPYTIVSTGSGGGRVLQQRLGRPARTTSVVLVQVSGQWRVADVWPG